MSERDYRDDASLSGCIADVYTEGMQNGQSWSCRSLPTDERDYAKARADRLEARVAELETALHEIVKWRGADAYSTKCADIASAALTETGVTDRG